MKNKKKSEQQFTEKQGQALVDLARNTIMEKLGLKHIISENIAATVREPALQTHCGTFVTLKKKGQLRGCIGSLSSDQPIVEGVKDNAINAAFHDFRFGPVSADEISNLKIEVSILTKPEVLEYKDSADLISKLCVNVDGVIIKKGAAQATFLPQVWEQLPDPDDFLTHLCMKAGLNSKAWEKTELQVLTYQVQYFEEH